MNMKIANRPILWRFVPCLVILFLISGAFPALSSQDINLVTNRPTMQTNQPSGRIVFRLATDTNLQIGL
ncbi:MAG: hypothetical protein ACI8S7_001635, partial [Candidatus Krumholzibacteriia bacterium]